MLTDAEIKRMQFLLQLRETHFTDGIRNMDFSGADLNKADLHGMQLVNVNFEGAILDGVNLYDSQLVNCNFNNTSLKRAILRKSSILDCSFKNSKLSQSDLSDSGIYNSRFIDTDMHFTKLINSKVVNTTFENCLFSNSNISGICMTGIIMDRCDLQYSIIDKSFICGCTLMNSKFNYASLNSAIIYDNKIENSDTENVLMLDAKIDQNFAKLNNIRQIDVKIIT
ncbi:pentapeptide repeat-containing protein [Methanocella sp. CWC-04]|uniref:Pentapeptide repeat-containing protein n=1 Tax=Methanooceanicella nereidis TaxID=2052831 RepID=A0AAP2RGH9_9EURY|nr:pentapeptide repeat-containing protein [Methanocella sp. CWC-04]MCD1295832.1 pentapeptide repeat-containing protein [Methanocella sp. CWC-04]